MHTSLSGCDLRDHMPLVRDIVKRIAIRLPFSVELTELEKRGVTGLRIAAEEYDSTRGCSFRAYAEYRIRGAILEQVSAQGFHSPNVRTTCRRAGRSAARIDSCREDVKKPRKMNQALNALPRDVQLAYRFHFFEELNAREIGDVLSVAESRVCEMLEVASRCMQGQSLDH